MVHFRKTVIFASVFLAYFIKNCAHNVSAHRQQNRPPSAITPAVLNQILHRFGNRVPVQPQDADNATDLDEPERRKNIYTDILFNYYNKSAHLIFNSSIQQDTRYIDTNCDPNGKFAIIVHGWNESCSSQWVNDLVINLNQYRGGCIICMDYGPYSLVQNYVKLYRHFNGILRILTFKLEQMLRAGFDPKNGYIFGFSFGAQLVLRAARRFGEQRFKEVDVCDPAGPGFDLIRTMSDFRSAAQNVQCIHTSQKLGTVFSTLCHQDWRLGNCGINQDAAGDPPCGSHGLCPYFYNSAFTNEFPAIPKPTECTATNPAFNWPTNFKMGYMESRKIAVNGELFAVTTGAYPFTPNNGTNHELQINIKVDEYEDVLLLPGIIEVNGFDFE